MREKLYYEKRIITDIRNNVFPIWEIYRIDERGVARQVQVMFEEDEFNNFRNINKVEFRQYSNRGIK